MCVVVVRRLNDVDSELPIIPKVVELCYIICKFENVVNVRALWQNESVVFFIIY